MVEFYVARNSVFVNFKEHVEGTQQQLQITPYLRNKKFFFRGSN